MVLVTPCIACKQARDNVGNIHVLFQGFVPITTLFDMQQTVGTYVHLLYHQHYIPKALELYCTFKCKDRHRKNLPKGLKKLKTTSHAVWVFEPLTR